MFLLTKIDLINIGRLVIANATDRRLFANMFVYYLRHDKFPPLGQPLQPSDDYLPEGCSTADYNEVDSTIMAQAAAAKSCIVGIVKKISSDVPFPIAFISDGSQINYIDWQFGVVKGAVVFTSFKQSGYLPNNPSYPNTYGRFTVRFARTPNLSLDARTPPSSMTLFGGGWRPVNEELNRSGPPVLSIITEEYLNNLATIIRLNIRKVDLFASVFMYYFKYGKLITSEQVLAANNFLLEKWKADYNNIDRAIKAQATIAAGCIVGIIAPTYSSSPIAFIANANQVRYLDYRHTSLERNVGFSSFTQSIYHPHTYGGFTFSFILRPKLILNLNPDPPSLPHFMQGFGHIVDPVYPISSVVTASSTVATLLPPFATLFGRPVSEEAAETHTGFIFKRS